MLKQPRGSAGSDLLFFVFFIIVLGIVWALTGGPDRAISHEGPFLNPPFPLGDGSGYSIPSVDTSSRFESVSGGSSSGTSGNTRGSGSLLESLITRFRTGVGEVSENDSPYAGSVTLSLGTAKNSDVTKEYVVLKTAKNLSGRLAISGWRIESSVTLAGTTLGDAAYLPYSGQVNTETAVLVPANTTIYVMSGRSPIGASFRVNACTGYFAQFQEFSPKLKQDCPDPEDELARKVSSGFVPNDQCIDLVTDLDRCTFTVSSLPSSIGAQCQDFIQNDLTYKGCVDAHKNDTDFYRDEWRLYLGYDQELWKSSHERIRLLDENGLVITSVSY